MYRRRAIGVFEILANLFDEIGSEIIAQRFDVHGRVAVCWPPSLAPA